MHFKETCHLQSASRGFPIIPRPQASFPEVCLGISKSKGVPFGFSVMLRICQFLLKNETFLDKELINHTLLPQLSSGCLLMPSEGEEKAFWKKLMMVYR